MAKFTDNMAPEVLALIPYNWAVIQNVPASDFRVEELAFISFIGTDEELGGREMLERARMWNNLGLEDAPRILANQTAIPASLRGSRIILPETVLRDWDGDPCVPSLWWHDGEWKLDFEPLYGYRWHSKHLVARPKQ